MNKSPNERINNLIEYLPERDIVIARRLVNQRNFNDLKSLVDSAIYKTEKTLDETQEIEVDLSKMEELKQEVDNYLIILGEPEDEVLEDYEDVLDEEDDWDV